MSDKIYYVCSYGGSGSKTITRYLQNFGKAYHVHSRFPPEKLEYIGRSTYRPNHSGDEHFNGVQVTDTDLKNSTVIYLYRNPVYVINSRIQRDINEKMMNIGPPEIMGHWPHLNHIQAPDSWVSLADIKEQRKDLYGLSSFHNNYMNPETPRNYKIICVNFEKIFSVFDSFNKYVGVPVGNDYQPENKRTDMKRYDNVINKYQFLKDVYADMNNQINNTPPICIR